MKPVAACVVLVLFAACAHKADPLVTADMAPEASDEPPRKSTLATLVMQPICRDLQLPEYPESLLDLDLPPVTLTASLTIKKDGTAGDFSATVEGSTEHADLFIQAAEAAARLKLQRGRAFDLYLATGVTGMRPELPRTVLIGRSGFQDDSPLRRSFQRRGIGRDLLSFRLERFGLTAVRRWREFVPVKPCKASSREKGSSSSMSNVTDSALVWIASRWSFS